MTEPLASWNDTPTREALVAFAETAAQTVAARGAGRGLRQRRHALVREADADRARLHPPAAGGDGRAGRVAPRQAAVAGRLREGLRVARRRRREALRRRRHRGEGAAGRDPAGVRGADRRRVRRSGGRLSRARPAPDPGPSPARLRVRPHGRAASLPRVARVHLVHRLRRQPRLHADGHPRAVRDPAAARDRQLERAAVHG